MSSLFVNYKEVCPQLSLIEQNFNLIQREFLENKDKLEYKDFTIEQERHIASCKRGYPIGLLSYYFAKNKSIESVGWHMGAVAHKNTLYEKNAQFLPILSKTLLQIKGLSVSGINILDPHVSLEWHSDDDYAEERTLRTLWGLDVPVEVGKKAIMQMRDSEGKVETRNFENGVVFAFLPDTQHRVENNLSQPRIILTIDVLL